MPVAVVADAGVVEAVHQKTAAVEVGHRTVAHQLTLPTSETMAVTVVAVANQITLDRRMTLIPRGPRTRTRISNPLQATDPISKRLILRIRSRPMMLRDSRTNHTVITILAEVLRTTITPTAEDEAVAGLLEEDRAAISRMITRTTKGATIRVTLEAGTEAAMEVTEAATRMAMAEVAMVVTAHPRRTTAGMVVIVTKGVEEMVP